MRSPFLKFAVLLALLGPQPSRAALLSEFSCARPQPLDEGSWHNVSLAASLLNGVVVPAGGEFSFLKVVALGRGRYLPGKSFSGGRVIKSVGGGYCQVSTSLYNAVLLAGLPVAERYPHSFYDESEAYVEPGRDAAVSGQAGADFKFLNATGAALTLTATALDGRVAVQIYGQGAPRRRWISTQARRIPARHLRREGVAPRPGFDGWEVKRSLNVADAEGNTRSLPLGTDRYDVVTAYE
jgi:hypothetical protein